MSAHAQTSSMFRTWLLPFSILLGLALTIFVITYVIDAQGRWVALWLFFRPNPSTASQTISNAGEVVAAVLGIAITVVAIVVELAANRYTHRITELFVAEPINFGVMGYFVVTALVNLWVGVTFDYQDGAGFVPYLGFGVAMTMLAVSLLILLPYFAFVLEFLSPLQIVDRIRATTMTILGVRISAGKVVDAQREAVRGIEQLADVGLNAMENKDKGVSMASVDALADMVDEYLERRARLPEAWFRVDGDLSHNPDFVSMAPAVLEDVTRRQIWLEMKVLRQYQTIYNEALNRMRDINYLIAIHTRHIAENAATRHIEPLLDLVLKFFNTYIRATINARDVRTAYNVLNQYRLLAESILNSSSHARAIEIAQYFKYYGLISFNAKLPFILETVAYDLCTLCELAFDLRSPSLPSLLQIFLDVDKESESEVQEVSLRGVRKAQVKLATYFLDQGDHALAREVFNDMERERPERLASIRDELLGVKSREFWEISDRGINFDFLDAGRKRQMLLFFDWFGDRLEPPNDPERPEGHTPSHSVPSNDV